MASESHLQNIDRGAFGPYFIILHLHLKINNSMRRYLGVLKDKVHCDREC